MRKIKSEKRLEKIRSVAAARQQSLRVVIENMHDPHNVSAIFRTCDATGIPSVSLIYTDTPFPKIGKKSSASAFKWVKKEKFNSVEECYSILREQGFKIYASSLTKGSRNFYDLNLSEKSAVVFGNEHKGVSNKAAEMADERFLIPMFGMVQSLNVSVAAAIVLYESLRQRIATGKYSVSELSDNELELLIDEMCKK